MTSLTIPKEILISDIYVKCQQYIQKLFVEEHTYPEKTTASIPKGCKEVRITFSYQVVATHPAYTTISTHFIKDLSEKSLKPVWNEVKELLTTLNNNAVKLKNKVS